MERYILRLIGVVHDCPSSNNAITESYRILTKSIVSSSKRISTVRQLAFTTEKSEYVNDFKPKHSSSYVPNHIHSAFDLAINPVQKIEEKKRIHMKFTGNLLQFDLYVRIVDLDR